jgi:protein involved in polysaccharide export with SLBB domain
MYFSPRLLAFVFFFFSAIPSSAEAQSAHRHVGPITSIDQLDNETHIQVGDQLIFRILEDEDPATTLTVSDSGQVRVPYLGNMVALNRTPRELAYQIKHALEGKLYKKATVMLSIEKQPTRSPGKIYVTGEIVRPGTIDLRANESLTLTQAILQLGGFSDFANKRKVKLMRKSGSSSEVKVVDVSAVVDQGRTDLDVSLKPGDVIVVPARFLSW